MEKFLEGNSMSKLVECVPNFSEGRDPQKLATIVAEIESVEGVQLLDQEMDKDHNRAVVTFVGEPENVLEAAFRSIAKATELINMETHQGEHPRMGATDVVPFVPISGVTIEECVELARRLGKRMADELNIPVYLYEAAAARPDRENLAEVRRGEYEGIKVAIATDPNRKPDFGPCKTHPTAGATAVGARPYLVAFNVYLGTTNLKIAKDIAKAIRFADGGLRYAKALGFEIKERQQVQVSMNLVNFEKTPIFRAYEMVKSEARRYGVPIISTEIVGLTPLQALVDVADFYLGLENFKTAQILEYKLKSPQLSAKQGMKAFLDTVAANTPTPGGGSVAALAGSLSAALGAMVCALTVGKKKYIDVSEELKDILKKLEALRLDLTFMIEKDAQGFEQVLLARRMPKYTEFETAQRNAKIQEATLLASSIPLEVMEKTVATMEMLPAIAEKGNVNSISDVGVANLMALAAVKGAMMNVKINLPGLEDEGKRKNLSDRANAALSKAQELFAKTEKIVDSKLQ
jgi:glutamate formiminotransferase / formiminotetrahydrofolate cyclodeaminase